jgi:hypothetical protein
MEEGDGAGDKALRTMRARFVRIDRKLRPFTPEEEDRGEGAGGVESDAYPLLPDTSVMHYFWPPTCQEDYPGYKDKLLQYGAWNDRALNVTADRKTPVCLNFVELLNIDVDQERQVRFEVAFKELVMRRPEKDVIGFWYKGGPRVRALDILCSRTAFGRMLTRKPNAQLEFNHGYEEVADETSRLNVWIREQRAIGREPGCFYLCDFAPRDVFIIRSKFPGIRIVGIACPSAASDADIVKILATVAAVAKAKATK